MIKTKQSKDLENLNKQLHSLQDLYNEYLNEINMDEISEERKQKIDAELKKVSDLIERIKNQKEKFLDIEKKEADLFYYINHMENNNENGKYDNFLNDAKDSVELTRLMNFPTYPFKNPEEYNKVKRNACLKLKESSRYEFQEEVLNMVDTIKKTNIMKNYPSITEKKIKKFTYHFYNYCNGNLEFVGMFIFFFTLNLINCQNGKNDIRITGKFMENLFNVLKRY